MSQQQVTCTEQSLRDVIAKHGGVLKRGAHKPEQGECCILEARSICLGLEMTDSPAKTGMPDIRRLNDASWSSDQIRTEQMIRLTVALSDWATWPNERERAWVDRVVVETVKQIIAELPKIPADLQAACRAVTTRSEARDVSRRVRAQFADAAAAYAYAADAAAYAADAAAAAAAAAAYAYAADAAAYAADAAAASAAYAAAAAADAAYAERDRILTRMVDLM